MVATVVFGFGTGLTAEDSTNATSYQDYSLPATPLAAPPTSVIVPSLTTPPPAETTIEVTEDPPLALPAVDESCNPAVDNHATSSDGTFLKCAYAGRSTARWVRSAPIIAYAEQGESCDPSARGIAVSPEGVDMVCVSNGGGEAGYWVLGTRTVIPPVSGPGTHDPSRTPTNQAPTLRSVFFTPSLDELSSGPIGL